MKEIHHLTFQDRQAIQSTSDVLPPHEEAGASWDVPAITGIIIKLSPFVQWFLYYFIFQFQEYGNLHFLY
jgi:hypothetical protein